MVPIDTQAKPVSPAAAGPHRLPAQAGEAIDRSRLIHFTFDGREYAAHPGDTIASALAAAGVKVFTRSFKYHRPRGLLCCAGQCPNCLVQVGEEPNVRACKRPVEAGMQVRHENAWPSLGLDLMSLAALGDRFMPVGFYYKTFIRPRAAWPLYEHVLRNVAGLGEVDPRTDHADYRKEFLHADVAVVGGGPAGLSAALAAARQGARVLLFDDAPALGGHLRFSSSEAAGQDGEESPEQMVVDGVSSPLWPSNLPGLLGAVQREPNITAYTDTTVVGWYKDHWLSALGGLRLYKVRARAVVVATGAVEQPLVFDNNDLPGVMLGSAVQRLLHLYGVAPGRRAVVVTANDDGWEVAADLHAAGVSVAAVVDEREVDEDYTDPDMDRYKPMVVAAARLGIPALWGHTIVEARGSGSVSGAVLAPVDSGGGVDRSGATLIECDLIAVSMGWAPALDLVHQAGGKARYSEFDGEIRPAELASGMFAAGRVTGTHPPLAQVYEGSLAGQAAAAHAGFGAAPGPRAFEALGNIAAAESQRTSTRVRVPGRKKQFVCYCEDVTDKDLHTAIEEGYDSLELLKRYSTVTMGPCQGKMCAMNAVHLCARENGWTVEQTGTTTSRQPVTPVPFGALAGQHMEPVQRTPIHDWHTAHGARMMVAGLWLRPERYTDPTAEVKAVRERVGLIDVSTLGKMRLTGPGVPGLLERLYINPWRGLGVGRVRYGVMCNDEAVVLDDGVCARLAPDDWYMTATSSGASAIFEWIQWWAQSGWGDGVHVTDLTEAFAALNLAGPASRAVLQTLAELDLSNEAFPYMHVREARVAGVSCRLLRIGFTGELSYEIHCPSSQALHVWEALMAAGKPFGLLPFGLEAQRVLRLEKAHLIIGQDTDAITDPISAGMGWAVKMDKPDFLGKRSLVRISAEGPKQRLVGFKMARPGVVPDEGLQIVTPGQNGGLEIIGWVSSSRFSPTLNEAIGLCWLPPQLASQSGASFTIRMNGRLEEALVFHGAFYDPEGKRLRQ